MQAARHTYVGYKINAIQVGLLSYDSRIYTVFIVTKTSHLTPMQPLFDCFINDRYPIFAVKL